MSRRQLNSSGVGYVPQVVYTVWEHTRGYGAKSVWVGHDGELQRALTEAVTRTWQHGDQDNPNAWRQFIVQDNRGTVHDFSHLEFRDGEVRPRKGARKRQ